MSFSASAADERVLDVQLTDDTFTVNLRDGRAISVPLVWYPRLLNATPRSGATGRSLEAATVSTGLTSTKT
jgi:Protein of unknown function (DUF2442)